MDAPDSVARVLKELREQLAARARAEAALRESEERYRIVTETATVGMISIDDKGTIVFVNAAAERMFGYSGTELLGRDLTLLIPESLRAPYEASLARFRATGERCQLADSLEVPGLHQDGHEIPLELSLGEYRQGGKHLFTGIVRDITERKRAEGQIRYLAHHDALTGLPNRLLFRDRVSQAIAQARRSDEKLAVLFLDLDGFKHINDSLGHSIGDEVLRVVARRLQGCLRAGDSIGRLGGDEFVVCLPVRQDERDPMLVARKIFEALGAPASINENELHINASIGIGLYPCDGSDADSLMRAADTAMYYAKEKGPNNYQFYTQRLNESAQRRLSIATRLHQAVQRNELLLEYQPQVDLVNGEIFAVEALVRWRHPELGLLMPSEFIKVAEETGLIGLIGSWVLGQACWQLRLWRASRQPNLRFAVNLSPEQFRRPGFPDSVLQVMHRYELPLVALDLEITENVLMMKSLEHSTSLERLAGAGIQFAVDDFGTGYSSLAYLQRFPIDTIKIDGSFISGVARDPNDAAIVTAIMAMAANLKLHIVAEGVETVEQAEFLKQHGCLAAQGFYYHRPMSADALGELLG
jgi:diguanylate cyclase (GGDEF)-like protein/PAS domain S-box-containing protein